MDSHFHGNDREDGLDSSSPYVRKNEKDKRILTPTLILPPRRGRKFKD